MNHQNPGTSGTTPSGPFAGMKDLFAVTKTLGFRLLPVGRTLEHMKNTDVIKTAKKLKSDYLLVKAAADRVHRRIIEETLAGFRLKYLSDGNMDSIQEYADTLASGKEKAEKEKALAAIAAALKKSVDEAFASLVYKGKKEQPLLKALESEILLKEILDKEELSAEERESLERMKKYTSFMRRYFETRGRMYKGDKGYTIGNRIVDDNLPVHLKNVKLFSGYPDGIKETVRPLFEILAPDTSAAYVLEDVFTASYASCLSAQSSIDAYNTLIGGISRGDGSRVQGINEAVNLYNQQAGKDGKKLQKLTKLKKQILSDRTTLSWVDDAIEDDLGMIDLIDNLHGAVCDTLPGTNEILAAVLNTDTAAIFIRKKDLATFSHLSFGNWKTAEICLQKALETTNPKSKRQSPEKYAEKIRKLFKKTERFSVKEIHDAVKEYGLEGKTVRSFADVVITNVADNLVNAENEWNELKDYLANTGKDESLGQTEGTRTESARAHIKKWLDTLSDARRCAALFAASENPGETDAAFFMAIIDPFEEIRQILVPTFNKVRNYLTKKPYSTDKTRLFFDEPSFLGGWASSVEETKRGVFLRKGDEKYLAILPTHAKSALRRPEAFRKDSEFERMTVYYVGDPSKQFPRIAFADNNVDLLDPSSEVLAIRASRKTAASFNKEETEVMAGYYIHMLETLPGYAAFDFNLKEPGDYANIQEFYDDVAEQGYRIEWNGVSQEYVNKCVENGDLYLFRIMNQDMRPGHYGKTDNQTAILNEAFSDRNALTTYIQIQGDAEIWFREASLPKKVTHPAGVPMVNKNPDNWRSTRTLSYDLYKDKRYMEDMLSLHLKVKVGRKNGKATRGKVNALVEDIVKDNPGMYVLGINRGETNLLSVAVTAPDGRIVEQRNLNVFDGFNYRRKLAEREKERNDDRQNWNSVRDIKNLKQGYLSRAVGEIVRLVKKYNCAVALESFDEDFFTSRRKFEKNVYEQFERDLVNRLMYLINKDDTDRISSALQLAVGDRKDPASSKGFQNGIVFFLNPGWITASDPITGFVNRLDLSFHSVQETQKLLSSLDSFKYEPKEKMFSLSFSYAKAAPNRITGDPDRVWKVYTNGDRSVYVLNEKSGKTELNNRNLTASMQTLLDGEGISFRDGKELLPKIAERSAAFYKEFLTILRLTLQNTVWDEKDQDYHVVCCTKDQEGRFFDSRRAPERLPQDSDINAAWNIARKCHMVLRNIREFVPGETTAPDGKKLEFPRKAVSDQEWLTAIQK